MSLYFPEEDVFLNIELMEEKKMNSLKPSENMSHKQILNKTVRGQYWQPVRSEFKEDSFL